jgi:two-component system cell cycle sensor histidine kinase/response regulator CckA
MLNPQGTETVLVVDDEDVVRKLVSRILRSQGYAVLDARNGGEAKLLSERHQGAIHLVLTDVVMPEISGRQLSEHLRAAQSDLKVLFMSGYSDDAIVQNGILKAEANFIQKPFSPESLARKVREVLDRHAS